MKKFGKMILSALILASLVTASWAQTAKISALSGKVEIQTSGSDWKSAKVGDILKKGSVISTGFKSSCTIIIDGSTVKLDPMTRITIEKLASNNQKSQTNIYLNNGKMGADVKKTAGKKVEFSVSSAASTASVRGTSFIFYSNGRLITTEGLVSKGPGRKCAIAVEDYNKEENETTETESAEPEIAETGAVESEPEIAEAGTVEPETVVEETSVPEMDNGMAKDDFGNQDQVDDFMPADGESTVFTETTEVSKEKGVPVFAGQTSSTDPVTGARTSPQAEAKKDKGATRGRGTESAGDKEKISSIGNDSVKTASDGMIESIKSGALVIDIELPQQ